MPSTPSTPSSPHDRLHLVVGDHRDGDVGDGEVAHAEAVELTLLERRPAADERRLGVGADHEAARGGVREQQVGGARIEQQCQRAAVGPDGHQDRALAIFEYKIGRAAIAAHLRVERLARERGVAVGELGAAGVLEIFGGLAPLAAAHVDPRELASGLVLAQAFGDGRADQLLRLLEIALEQRDASEDVERLELALVERQRLLGSGLGLVEVN